MIATKLLKPIHQIVIDRFGSVSIHFAGDKDNAFQSMFKLFERGRCLCNDMLICQSKSAMRPR